MDKEFSNIRIVDIAKMAGVSVGTVDRVIHNRGRVSEENKKKVQAILLLSFLRSLTVNIGRLFPKELIKRLRRWSRII